MKILLVLLLLTPNVSIQQVHYVKPNNSTQECPNDNEPCFTLDEYGKYTNNFFTTGAFFLFLAGNHTLHTVIKLTNVSDLIFQKLRSATEVANVILYENDATILCESVTNLRIEGLRFTSFNTTVLNAVGSTIQIINSEFQAIHSHHVTMARSLHSTYSTVIIANCQLEANRADEGGAVLALNSVITLVESTFISNKAKVGGAIFANGSTINMVGLNEFLLNSAETFGGAIFCNKCTLNVTGNHTFTSNWVVDQDLHGGAIAIINGFLSLSGSAEFYNNSAHYGGAIYLSGSNCSLSGEVLSLRHNSATRGGGICSCASSQIIANVRLLYFTQNSAEEWGGALSISDSTSILGKGQIYFSNNTGVNRGGAISCKNCSLIICGEVYFTENRVTSVQSSLGGAVYIENGAISTNMTTVFTKNQAFNGGGIYLDSVNASFTGRTKFSKNSAKNGGGISITTSMLKIRGAQFIHNVAQESGGAIHAVSVNGRRSILISSTKFLYNIGNCGGGLRIEGEKNVTFKLVTAIGNFDSAIYTSESNMTFSALLFTNNTGQFGGGIQSKNSHLSFHHRITFRNNKALIGGAVYSLHGTISYSSIRSYILLFTLNVAERDGGALYAMGTDITFGSSVNFTYNSAQNGGAMYFRSDSILRLTGHLTTSYNHAYHYGGGIFNEDNTTPNQCGIDFDKNLSDNEIMLLPYCFMQLEIDVAPGFSNQREIIASYNNSAEKAGHFLYGGLLDRCQMVAYKHHKSLPKVVIPYKLIINNQFAMVVQNSITSQPYQLCFCSSTAEYCSHTKHIEIHTGQTMKVRLAALDQVKAPTSTLVTALIRHTARLKLSQSSQVLQPYCSELTYNIYSTENFEELILYPDGPCRDVARAVVNVTLLPCPDIFIQSGEECVCEERLQQYDVECVIDESVYVRRRATSRLWLSTLYENQTYHGLVLYKTCPFQYCVSGRTISISLDNLDIQCDLNRSGILCGACLTNYSLLLGSSSCHICSNSHLALLLPFAAAGIALVVFLSLLKITVATGMLNSIILYANILQANKDFLLPTNMRNILTVFIAWMNLDLGFQTCFYDGMDAYAYTWLQFVFPLYIWTLISLIILVSRYSITVSKLIGSNPIAVLATLLLMSYAKILRILIDVYSSVDLDYPDNKTVTVWIKDGNIPYLKSKHLFLTVATSLILVFFFLPYTFLLLLGYKLYRFTGRKGFWWLNRIKPLLDSYYAPYKTHTRYWTGLLLLVRCILYIVFSYNSLGATSESLLAINIMFTAIIVIAWLSVQIYKKFFANIVEASMYLNLIVLASVSLAEANTPMLVNSLVGIVFATTIGIVILHFHLMYIAKLPQWQKFKANLSRFVASVKNLMVHQKISPMAPSIDLSSTQDSRKDVSKTVIELREPLLEK